MKRIHWILTGLSLTIVALSVNRLASFTLNYLQPYEFLRWLDFHAMLTIPLASIVLYFLLKTEVIKLGEVKSSKWFVVWELVFVIGVYLFGAGSGDHEVTNYMNTRFCGAGEIRNQICNIISFNDDEFSHLVYYAGFVLLNLSLMGLQYILPLSRPVSSRDLSLIMVNGAFIALGIFANLAFEPSGLDLIFFGSVMAANLYILLRKRYQPGQLPVIVYFATSYTLGVIGTIVYKLVTG